MKKPSLPLSHCLLLALVFSGCSMIYEFTIAKTLAQMSGDITLWESLTIGIFIAGIGLGSFLLPKVDEDQLIKTLLRVELILCLLGTVAILIMMCIHTFYRIYIIDFEDHWISPLTVILLGMEPITLLLGVLSGYELALLMSLLGHQRKRYEAIVIALYHVGSLVAAILFGFLMRQGHSMMAIAAATSLANAAAAAYLFYRDRHTQRKIPWSILLPVALSLNCIAAAPHIEQLYLKNLYYNRFRAVSLPGKKDFFGTTPFGELRTFLGRFPEIQTYPSPYQKIHIVFESTKKYFDFDLNSSEDETEFSLYLNRHFQFLSSQEKIYHEFLAHLPLMITKSKPREILVIGGGDGLLVRELLRHSPEKILLIELDPVMTALAKQPLLAKLNQHSLSQPTVHVENVDGLHWLRSHQSSFDAIYLDLPVPYDSDGARLYSREFMSLVQKHLKPGGFLAMDVPFQWIEPKHHLNRMLESTLRSAGFQTILAFTPNRRRASPSHRSHLRISSTLNTGTLVFTCSI